MVIVSESKKCSTLSVRDVRECPSQMYGDCVRKYEVWCPRVSKVRVSQNCPRVRVRECVVPRAFDRVRKTCPSERIKSVNWCLTVSDSVRNNLCDKLTKNNRSNMNLHNLKTSLDVLY